MAPQLGAARDRTRAPEREWPSQVPKGSAGIENCLSTLAWTVGTNVAPTVAASFKLFR